MLRTWLIRLSLLGALSACDGAPPPPTPQSARQKAREVSTTSAAVGADTPGASSTSPSPSPLGTAPSRTEERAFDSAALGVKKRYDVYLPTGYDDSKSRYPVIYMLHGLGGNETNWLKVGGLKEAADALTLQAIVIMPDGDASFYANSEGGLDYEHCRSAKPLFDGAEPVDSFCVKTPRYEQYMVKDLIGDVESHYRALSDKHSRGIGGLSMGGFGAFELGLRHPDLFAAIASHSGLVSLLYNGPHPYAGKADHADSIATWGLKYPPNMSDQLKGIFGPSLQNWRDHDPVTLAAKLGSDAPKIYIDCGTEDDFKFEDQASELHDVLTQKHVEHSFALVPGHHSFTLWKTRLPESLKFFAQSLTLPK